MPDNEVFAGFGQENIACEFVRCVKYWARDARELIDFLSHLAYNYILKKSFLRSKFLLKMKPMIILTNGLSEDDKFSIAE